MKKSEMIEWLDDRYREVEEHIERNEIEWLHEKLCEESEIIEAICSIVEQWEGE